MISYLVIIFHKRRYKGIEKRVEKGIRQRTKPRDADPHSP